MSGVLTHTAQKRLFREVEVHDVGREIAELTRSYERSKANLDLLAFQLVERMVGWNLLQSYAGLNLWGRGMVAAFILADYLHASHEAPFAAFGGKSLALSLKISVELWQFLPEIIYATIKKLFGREG